MPPSVITAGETEPDVWCVPCNAPVAIRIPLYLGDTGTPPAAWLTVCASCGNYAIPHVPSVTLTHPPRWRTPRPWLALQWRLQRPDCAARRITPRGCAVPGC